MKRSNSNSQRIGSVPRSEAWPALLDGILLINRKPEVGFDSTFEA